MPRIPDVVISLYALSNRAGLLEYRISQRVFSALYFLYKRCSEDPYASLVKQRPDLFAGGHILDVGANIGYTAALFAKALTESYRVYAFEPEKNNFTLLSRSLSESGLKTRVVAVQAAVGDHEGTADLWLNPKNHADHRMVTEAFHGEPGGARQVQGTPLVRLDDFCSRELPGQPIRFIKIDVQGYEECVCRGMQDVLRKNPRAWVGLEYYPEGMERLGFNPSRVLSFFQEREYRAYFLFRHKPLEAVSYEDVPKAMANKGYVDLVFSKSDALTLHSN